MTPRSHVSIVPIASAHADGFHACLDAVAREKRYLAQMQAPPIETVRGFVRDSVAADAAQFVALDGVQVVGWADVFAAWPEATAHCGTLGMGVLAGYRRRGIGRRLLEACLAKAGTKGLTRVELHVRADNDAAVALYLALGFEHEAILPRAMRFDGVYHDALQMRRLHPAISA